MGDIKKIRKKYSKPSHPWRQARIDEENAICKEYGVERKTEVWKTISKLESFKNQAKKLSTLSSTQADLERKNLFEKMQKYGLIKPGESADAILGVTLKDILNRRLQTIIFKKGYAKGMKQARQMITHRHILLNNKILTSPSYLVKTSEESMIEISPKSPFYDVNHAERVKEATKRVKVVKPEGKFDRRRKR